MKAKPLGPIPHGYSAIDGELAIGGQTTTILCARAGQTPLFVYSSDMLKERIASLRNAMPDDLSIHFAMKANPYAPLLELMAGMVDGLDIASGGELTLALAAGMDASKISFAGPGKRDEELRSAIEAGVTINLESEGEADRAIAISKDVGKQARLAVRVNPDFDLKGSGMRMGGGAKPFGVDEGLVVPLVTKIIAARAHWRGFHIFAGSQALSADAVIETQAQTIALAARLAGEIGQAPEHVNLGGGFGIPYFPGDKPIDTGAIGNALTERFKSLPNILSGTKFAIELGRYLVGEAGVYLTKIVDRKISHGQTFLVTDGGLHHQLAASGNFGTVIKRNYPAAIATRFQENETEIATIVGCLCTPLDQLAVSAELPRAEVGDIVAIFCAGAYGASASPSAFLGQGPALEMLV